MSEKTFKVNGVDICTEAFGDPANPAVLLIMGACASMLWWPDELCRRIANTGRYAIRYDNRDTGCSITYPPGQPCYSLDDMGADAVGVLDAYGIAKAHIAGMSLGGMIAQIAVLSHPERVLSVALLMSGLLGPLDSDLPPVDEKVLAYHRSAATVDWTDQTAVVNYSVGGWQLLCGKGHAFDEPMIRAIATREVARSHSLLSMFNHALLTGGEKWYGKMGQISVPTLVVHGTDDPVLPYPHGIALTREIPHARLLTLEGTGHELHPDDWDKIIGAMTEHTAGFG